METDIMVPSVEVLESVNTPAEENVLSLSSQERRIILDEKVYNMILRGKTRKQCIKFISDESARLGFKNSPSHCSNIYQQVKVQLKHELEENKEYVLAELTSKMSYLYEKNLEKDDFKEARECLKEIAKLAGVSNGPAVEIQRPDENITITFT